MEPQDLVIGAAVFVVTAVILYLVSIWGFREKTYEEVIAEQRRQQELAGIKSKSDKDKKEKKKKYKKGKGKAEDSPPGSDREQQVAQGEPKMVEYEPEPEVIEPAEEIHVEKALRKGKKQPKSILHNREEKSYTRDDKEVQESFHPSHLPKDELELKHDHEGQKKHDKKIKTEVKPEKERERQRAVVDEVVTATTATQQSVQSAAPPSEGKKKKARGDAGDGLATKTSQSGSKLISTVESADLTEVELQTMIDILLQRQASSSQWMKKSQKGDPMTFLKKQLEDKEQTLAEEQRQASSAISKLKELRQELTQEKTKNVTIEKRYGDKLSAQTNEIQALHARMQASHEQQMAEVNRLKATSAQGQLAEQGAIMQRLTEENRHLKEAAHISQQSQQEISSLKQQLSIIQTELSNSVRTMNAGENARKTMEQKLMQYEGQVKHMEQTKVEDASQQVRQLEHQTSSLTKELEAVANQKKQAENECANLKNRLQSLESSQAESVKKATEAKAKEVETIRVELQAKVKSAEDHLSAVILEKDTEVQKLRLEAHQLSSELKIVQEKAVTTASATVNGDVHDGESAKKIAVEEHEKILKESSKQLEQMRVELQTKSSVVDAIKAELESQKKKNNELQEQFQNVSQSNKTQETVNVDIVQLQVQLDSKNSELSKLRSDNDSTKADFNKISNELKTARTDYQGEVGKLQVELKTTKESKNKMADEKSKLAAELEGIQHKLKEEVNKLQSELSSTVADMDNMAKELETLRGKTGKQDDDETALRVELESRLEEVKTLRFEITTLNKENVEQSQEKAKLNEFAMQNKDLSEQLAKLQDQLVNRIADVDSLTQELESQHKAKNALEEQVEQARQSLSESENSADEIARLQSVLESRDSAIKSLKEQLAMGTKENDVTITDSQSSQLVLKLRAEIEEKISEVIWLCDELETQKKINIDLREKNYEAMDALEQAEKAAKNSKSVTEDPGYKEMLTRVFPEVKVSTTNPKDWLSLYEKEASSYVSQLKSRVQVEDEKSKKVETDLQSQLDHYKSVLANTEGMLNKLQNSVESEEKKWQIRLQESDSELSKTQSELDHLQDELTKVKGSTEMEDRIKGLESKLAAADSEKQSLQRQVEQQINDLKSKLGHDQKSKSDEFQKLQQDAEIKDKQITDIKSQLENEQKSNKDTIQKLQQELEGKDKQVTDTENELKSNAETVKKLQQDLEIKEKQVSSTLQQQVDEQAPAVGDDVGTSV